MLLGFEKQTHNLTEQEEEVARKIANGFNLRRGEENAITSAKIVEKMGDNYGVKMSDARLRKMVNWMRHNDVCDGLLCGTGNGYFLAKDIEEARRAMTGLKQRAGSTMASYNNQLTLAFAYFGEELYPEDKFQIEIDGKTLERTDYKVEGNKVIILTKELVDPLG